MRLGPACPQTRSLRATHRREHSTDRSSDCVLRCHRLHIGYGGCGFHRVGHRLGFRFATGLASSFSIRTGLAGTITLPIFALPRFWSCYRSPGSFLPEVRPYALKGQLPPTFPYSVGIQLAVRRRTERCHARCYLHALLEEEMVPLRFWRPGRRQHLEIALPSLHVEELEAFPEMGSDNA